MFGTSMFKLDTSLKFFRQQSLFRGIAALAATDFSCGAAGSFKAGSFAADSTDAKANMVNHALSKTIMLNAWYLMMANGG